MNSIHVLFMLVAAYAIGLGVWALGRAAFRAVDAALDFVLFEPGRWWSSRRRP